MHIESEMPSILALVLVEGGVVWVSFFEMADGENAEAAVDRTWCIIGAFRFVFALVLVSGTGLMDGMGYLKVKA